MARAQLADLVLPTQTANGHPAPALKFRPAAGDGPPGRPLSVACTHAGVTNGRPRPIVAQLLGVPANAYTARQMGYDLRRLARKGLLGRVPGRLCYTLTPFGRRVAPFLTKVHARVLRPGLQALDTRIVPKAPRLRTLLAALDAATDALIEEEARLAA